MTREERIAKIRGDRWIRYPRAEAIAAKLDELFAWPRTHRMPNLLIVGETNNGKTALIRRFVQRHEPTFGDHRNGARVPIVLVQAPPVPDERRFHQAIMTQLFQPFRPSHTIARMQHEALRVLATAKVRMLIVDEIQHVLAGPLLKQRHFLNVIKYLGNELRIPIVAAGTPDAFNAIQTDAQLANRFEPAVLPRWTMDEDYLRLLASFETMLPLTQPSKLVEAALAGKILRLSGGTIGEIAALVTRAALWAIDSGAERITAEALDACGYVSPAERRNRINILA